MNGQHVTATGTPAVGCYCQGGSRLRGQLEPKNQQGGLSVLFGCLIWERIFTAAGKHNILTFKACSPTPLDLCVIYIHLEISNVIKVRLPPPPSLQVLPLWCCVCGPLLLCCSWPALKSLPWLKWHRAAATTCTTTATASSAVQCETMWGLLGGVERGCALGGRERGCAFGEGGEHALRCNRAPRPAAVTNQSLTACQ